MPMLKSLKNKMPGNKKPEPAPKPLLEFDGSIFWEVPEMGTPERVQYEVTLRNIALKNVKAAREAHNKARASR